MAMPQSGRRSDNDTAVWRATGRPLAIEYSRMVMEELRVAAEEGFQKIPHGGIEVGALLLGTRAENTVRVLEWRPMDCEHARGPGFVLSERDLAGVETLMAQCATAPELRGLEPVGWFHTHTRSKVFLSADDLAVYNRFFPESWQVSLVMRVTKERAPSAGFFFREPDGSVKCDATHQEFAVLSDPSALIGPTRMTALRKGGLSRREVRPIRPVAGDPEPISLASAPADQPRSEAVVEPTPTPIPLPVPAPEEARFPWKVVAIVALVVIAITGALAAYRTLGGSRPMSASLRLDGAGSQLMVRWDHDSDAVARAERGVLNITDGTASRTVELNTDDVKRGVVIYQRQAEDVEVRLQLLDGNAVVASEMARYLGPPLAAQAPASSGSPSAVERAELDRIISETEKLRLALAEQEKRGRELLRDIRRTEGRREAKGPTK